MRTSLWTIGRPEDLRAELFARSLDVMVAAALPQPLVFAARVPETGALARNKCHGTMMFVPGGRHAGRAEELHGPLGVRDHLSVEALLVFV